jgi:hypothetical protein
MCNRSTIVVVRWATVETEVASNTGTGLPVTLVCPDRAPWVGCRRPKALVPGAVPGREKDLKKRKNPLMNNHPSGVVGRISPVPLLKKKTSSGVMSMFGSIFVMSDSYALTNGISDHRVVYRGDLFSCLIPHPFCKPAAAN